MVVFEPIAKILLILHTISTIILVGAVTHNFFLMIGYFRGNISRIKLHNRYVRYGFASFIFTYLLTGALIYPTFRVRVRYDYLDKNLPWLTGLFEIKEHWMSMALAIFISYYLLNRFLDLREDKHLVKIYSILGIILSLVIWYATIASFLIGSYKSI